MSKEMGEKWGQWVERCIFTNIDKFIYSFRELYKYIYIFFFKNWKYKYFDIRVEKWNARIHLKKRIDFFR